MQAELLIERIKELPPDKLAEVADFVEFLWQRMTKPRPPIAAENQAVTLQAIAESMQANAFTGDPPRFSREELHERR